MGLARVRLRKGWQQQLVIWGQVLGVYDAWDIYVSLHGFRPCVQGNAGSSYLRVGDDARWTCHAVTST